ncbi:MAG: hypothetical protein PHT79_00595 [Syntrophomonadaceae bacterium]|nr:hypothetical protein [Syntrophomonadaceae bacterium]MDD3888630.1 hypothetical protein [Syntrophomonadaceae bacterium]MDD4548253.1 hypothetical protein [Syntrophomonadaceae bacterium]
MTIRSIDMQVLVQKVGDVAKIQQVQQSDHANRQQEFAQQIAQQTEKNTKTVNQPLQNQSKLIHEKQEKEKQSRKYRNKEGKKDNKENNDDNVIFEPNKGKTIDIKI